MLKVLKMMGVLFQLTEVTLSQPNTKIKLDQVTSQRGVGESSHKAFFSLHTTSKGSHKAMNSNPPRRGLMGINTHLSQN